MKKTPRNHLGLLTAIALSTIPAWSQESPKPALTNALPVTPAASAAPVSPAAFTAPAAAATPASPASQSPQEAIPTNTVTLKVDSPAAIYSPGNWSGDTGRGGSQYRQTWCIGGSMLWNWETPTNNPKATLLLDDSMFTTNFSRPLIAYSIDGIWKSKVPVRNEIEIPELKNPGTHELRVVLDSNAQLERWGAPGQSANNVLRVRGLRVDEGSKPVPKKNSSNWAMIIGDSITEGTMAPEFTQYAWLIGQALASVGWDYGISACGWSGWLAPGDSTHDVPGFYVMTNSVNGSGGTYLDSLSRWNKIDGNNHTLLDANGHFSGWGGVNQEPTLILINYGTNDKTWFNAKSSASDFTASVRQGLAAVRSAAPRAKIVVLIPFGQFGAKDLKAAVQERITNGDTNIALIDLGPEIARALSSPGKPFGDLHPNAAGHAWCASLIIPRLFTILGLNPR